MGRPFKSSPSLLATLWRESSLRTLRTHQDRAAVCVSVLVIGLVFVTSLLLVLKMIVELVQ